MGFDSDSDDDVLTGALVVYYRRESPESCNCPEYCKSVVDLAIDSYNNDKENSKKYHVVELLYLKGVGSFEGYYLSTEFTAKLDDTSDVVTFEAHLFADPKGTIRVECVDIVGLSNKEPQLQHCDVEEGLAVAKL